MISQQADLDSSLMSTVVESLLRSPHSVSSISVYFYRSITTKSNSFFPPISLKLSSSQLHSLLFLLSQLDTLRRHSQHRISHLESEETRASGKLNQIHQDQKINPKPSKPLLSPPPRSLQRVPFLYTLCPVFSNSAQLSTSPSLPKLHQVPSHQFPQISRYSSVLPESDSSYPIVNALLIENGSN